MKPVGDKIDFGTTFMELNLICIISDFVFAEDSYDSPKELRLKVKQGDDFQTDPSGNKIQFFFLFLSCLLLSTRYKYRHKVLLNVLPHVFLILLLYT